MLWYLRGMPKRVHLIFGFCDPTEGLYLSLQTPTTVAVVGRGVCGAVLSEQRQKNLLCQAASTARLYVQVPSEQVVCVIAPPVLIVVLLRLVCSYSSQVALTDSVMASAWKKKP